VSNRLEAERVLNTKKQIVAFAIIMIILGFLGLLITTKILGDMFRNSFRGPWHEFSLSQKQDILTEELALEFAAKVMEKDGFDMNEWKPIEANPSATCPGEKFVARRSSDDGTKFLKEGSIRYRNRPEPIRDVELELKDGKIRGRVWREK